MRHEVAGTLTPLPPGKSMSSALQVSPVTAIVFASFFHTLPCCDVLKVLKVQGLHLIGGALLGALQAVPVVSLWEMLG